jgi:hypothetical protein
MTVGVPAAEARYLTAELYRPPRGGEVPKSRLFETAPDKTDQGTTAHKDTKDALAEALRKASLKPRSPKSGDPACDIAWRDDDVGGVAFICEVKSLTDENEAGQIRLAIGQVLDYVHALTSLREADSLPAHWEGVHATRAVVAVERRPPLAAHDRIRPSGSACPWEDVAAGQERSSCDATGGAVVGRVGLEPTTGGL